MDDQQSKEVFLVKAMAAEEQSLKTADPEAKEDWLRIAKAYRTLADHFATRP